MYASLNTVFADAAGKAVFIGKNGAKGPHDKAFIGSRTSLSSPFSA